MRPRHWHLVAAVILAVIAAATAIEGQLYLTAFLGAGALIALVHWKATKAGIIDC